MFNIERIDSNNLTQSHEGHGKIHSIIPLRVYGEVGYRQVRLLITKRRKEIKIEVK